MFDSIMVVWHQALEAFEGEGTKGMIRPRIFWKRKATPVEMDLTTVASFPAEILRESGCELVELNLHDLRAGRWIFMLSSRRFKASRNIKQGWRGFALHQDNRVIGDVWCVTPDGDGRPVTHPDLAMLGIVCGNRDAYAFDMLIAPAFRGRNLAASFQRSLQAILKAEGFQKVYGYYWDDNLPALWMHRIIKFKELQKRQVSRFLFFVKAETIGKSNPRR